METVNVVISQDQVDLLLFTLLALSCSLAVCLGFLANEMGAK